MSGILVLADHRQGELSVATLEVIRAASMLKSQHEQPLSVAILSKDPGKFVGPVSVTGVDEVITIETPIENFQPDIYESAVLALAGERTPAVILMPHSVDAWGYAPVVAIKGGFGFASDVFAIHYDGNDLVASRAAYAEKMHMEVDFPGKKTILVTIRGNVFKPVEGTARPKVTTFGFPGTQMHTEHLEFIEPESGGDVDITQAEHMLSIGRGISEEDNVEQFQELADLMGFTLGCSRPIADNGWLPKSRQVGQSGKTASSCTIYIAMGISGSVQHMAGMKHVPNVIAVNTDAEASIFSIARYGVVADIFEISDELRTHFE